VQPDRVSSRDSQWKCRICTRSSNRTTFSQFAFSSSLMQTLFTNPLFVRTKKPQGHTHPQTIRIFHSSSVLTYLCSILADQPLASSSFPLSSMKTLSAHLLLFYFCLLSVHCRKNHSFNHTQTSSNHIRYTIYCVRRSVSSGRLCNKVQRLPPHTHITSNALVSSVFLCRSLTFHRFLLGPFTILLIAHHFHPCVCTFPLSSLSLSSTAHCWSRNLISFHLILVSLYFAIHLFVFHRFFLTHSLAPFCVCKTSANCLPLRPNSILSYYFASAYSSFLTLHAFRIRNFLRKSFTRYRLYLTTKQKTYM
jgi:hypothetical protein